MAKRRNAEKCKELAQHRPLSKAFSQNDASFCTDPTFTKFFKTQKDPVMEEASAVASANTDSNLLQKIWQKLSSLDKIENKVDTALKRLDRLEQHAQDFSQDLEPSHHKLKEELLLTKEVIRDIIPNLPEFSENGLVKNDDEEQDGCDHFGAPQTLDEITLQNLERNGRDDFEPELFFMEEEMGDLCTSLHTPSPDRKSMDVMYLVDFPNSSDRLDTPSTPFSETYDLVSPVGAPSEFYPNLSEISGSNDHDDFTVQGASIKDASEVGDEEDYEEYYEDEDEEDQDSEDDYWRLCPNEQVNQFGMSTIQRTSMGLLEQISRLQEELGVSAVEDEDTESTEEEVHEHGLDSMEGGYPCAPGLEDVQVFLPDIDAMMQNEMDDDELEMPHSVADLSDVADLEDIAVKLRHASLGDEDADLDYMTIEEFQMISGDLTSKSSNESTITLPSRQVLVKGISASLGPLKNSSGQSSDNDDSWENDYDDSYDNSKEDNVANGHSFHIHGMTIGSGYDGSSERTLSGPYIGEVPLNRPPSDFDSFQGNVGSDVSCGRTVSLLSEESVPFVTPLDSFDIDHDHVGGGIKGYVSEGKSVPVEKQNGETHVNKVDSDNVKSKSTLDSIETVEPELDNVEQQPRSISEKINSLNAAFAQNWGLKTNFKKRSLMKKFRKSLERKSVSDSDSNDNSNSGESVVSDSVLTISEARKAFEERTQQIERKKTQLKKKMSSVETHLGKASSVIKSGDVPSGSSSHSCHPDTSIDTKSEHETVAKQPLGNITKIQKHFSTGIGKDVTPPQLPLEQLPPNQENGMGHQVRSKVNGVYDQEESKLNGGDGLDQVPLAPVEEVEADKHEESYYAIVNRSSDDEGNDEKTDATQDPEYAEPTFPQDPDHGYAEPQINSPVVKEETLYSSVTDTAVESQGVIDNGEETNPSINVDTMGDKNEVLNRPGYEDTSRSSAQKNRDNDYEIITPMQIKPEYAQIKKEVPVDVCEKDTYISKSASRDDIRWDSPDLIKTLPDVPLKAKPLVFQKKEEKMEQEKDVEKKDEVQVVRNLLPSEIKKQQVGSTGMKVKRSNVNKLNTQTPPKPKPDPNPPQSSVDSSKIEVVHRPPGSRRARIIRSYLELERIKREGVNRADGKPFQITAPSLSMMGSGMKGVSGSGGGVRGSDAMLEDMINLQLMQAMGVNPHTIAIPAVDTTSKSTPPSRPSHLPIPTPIKTTKPVPKQPPSRSQTSGPSHGIAKMLNRFGESSAPAPKPAFQGFHSNGKTSTAPASKGLRKTPVRNAFNIEMKDGEVEVNLKDDNRQLLMNKLASHSRGKGKLP